MERMSKAQMIARLGRAPQEWDFHGQCFDAGEGKSVTCVVTEKPTRFAFTLKPKHGGKGRVYVGPSALSLFRRYAPELFVKLEAGRTFLQISVNAERRHMVEASLIKRVATTEKRFVRLKMDARSRLKAYRMQIRQGELPEYLQAVRALLQRPEPKFDTPEAKALWCEQNATELEAQLLQSQHDGRPVEQAPVFAPLPETTVPEPVVKRRVVRREKTAAVPQVSAFTPIPEIEF
jgi:hypothetical protein